MFIYELISVKDGPEKRTVCTVVQHWHLAINRDSITVGFTLSFCHSYILDPTPKAEHPLHHTIAVLLINPDGKQCGKDWH